MGSRSSARAFEQAGGRRRCGIATACALFWIWGTAGASSGEQVVLDLRGSAQEAAQWCWAAGGQSVMRSLAPELELDVCQCRQAEDRSPGVQCCASPGSCTPSDPLRPECRDLGWPDLRSYGFDFQTTCDPLPQDSWDRCRSQPLDWVALVGELRMRRPVLRCPSGKRA